MFTEQQKDWMGHLIRLNIDRVEKPTGLNVHDVKRLKGEIGAQRIVLARIATDKPLTGVLIDVARYMLVYADLHIEWYGNRLDEVTFRARVLAAKKRMWDALSREARSYVQARQRKRETKMETVVETSTTAPDAPD
jgi:hypothetical protein